MVQFDSIHEHIFGSDPSKGSLYDGFFTHGGYLPYSDNGYFLIGMQSFLNYSLPLSIAVFRPEGMFWYAFLYEMAGGSMILYMYLQAILSTDAVCITAV